MIEVCSAAFCDRDIGDHYVDVDRGLIGSPGDQA
jgi:hypothetical protein